MSKKILFLLLTGICATASAGSAVTLSLNQPVLESTTRTPVLAVPANLMTLAKTITKSTHWKVHQSADPLSTLNKHEADYALLPYLDTLQLSPWLAKYKKAPAWRITGINALGNVSAFMVQPTELSPQTAGTVAWVSVEHVNGQRLSSALKWFLDEQWTVRETINLSGPPDDVSGILMLSGKNAKAEKITSKFASLMKDGKGTGNLTLFGLYQAN